AVGTVVLAHSPPRPLAQIRPDQLPVTALVRRGLGDPRVFGSGRRALGWNAGHDVYPVRRFSRALAVATTLSTVKPNSCCSAFNGAEAPKVCMPMTFPSRPT